MAIAAVGSAVKASSVGTAASIGVSITATAGNRLIAVAHCMAAKIGGVSGSSSGAFTADKTFNDVAGVGIFSVVAAGGTETITFTPTTSDLLGITVQEFSGIASSGYSGGNASAGDISATATLASALTPSVDNCLVIGGLAYGTGSAVTFALPTGYTLIGEIESDSNTGEGESDYLLQTTATATNPSWTISSGGWWAIAVQAYKPQVSAGRTTRNTRAFPLGMAIGMNWLNPGECS